MSFHFGFSPLGRGVVAGFPGVLSFSPALWLDASDSNTLYDATTGGSLVAADGLVARWQDKSGNAYHATQASAGAKPQRKTNVVNGLDVLRFAGAQWVLTPTVNFASTTKETIFAVYKGTGNCLEESTSAWVNAGCVYGDPSSFYVSQNTTTFASVRETSSTDNAAYSVWTAARDSSLAAGSQLNILKNGGGVTVTRTYNTNITAAHASVGIYIGKTNSSPDFLTGDLLELIILKTVLATPQRQAIERYLGAKWGITVE
jgi:hypothetical protein